MSLFNGSISVSCRFHLPDNGTLSDYAEYKLLTHTRVSAITFCLLPVFANSNICQISSYNCIPAQNRLKWGQHRVVRGIIPQSTYMPTEYDILAAEYGALPRHLVAK